MTRISSLDTGYVEGQLSVYPEALDTREELYEVKNNAETTLKQALTYNGKYLVVEDTSSFPDQGMLRIGPAPGKAGNAEIIYYGQKTNGVFKSLIRGFAGSRQNQWNAGSYVTNSVLAESHNAIKDAVINIQTNLGLEEFPAAESLNDILKDLEIRFLAPKPLFRAYPFKGPPPLRVRFQNFSTGRLIRFLWDFGDGTTSVDENPTHTYQTEGIYTVKLNIVTSAGAQGVVTKSNYITVSDEERIPFVYASPTEGYSTETANARTLAGNPTEPTEFLLVDQTDGDIIQRYWIFDGAGSSDGVVAESQSVAVLDPNIHTVSYVYDSPGTYEPSLLIVYSNQKQKRAFLKNTITVF